MPASRHRHRADRAERHTSFCRDGDRRAGFPVNP
jgi:hypothetical protein